MNGCRSLAIALTVILLLPACASPQDSSGRSGASLRRIKVACVYESVTDGRHRDIEAVANLLAETKTDYVHRGFYRWTSALEIESPEKRRSPDVYAVLKEAITAIKKKRPDILFGGAIPAPELSVVEHDPITDEIIPREKTWAMAFDPQKYGFPISREKVYERVRETARRDLFAPDITHPDFQRLFLNLARKQIDCGVDAIWIDGLLVQASLCAQLANNDLKHPSVKAAIEASRKIVDEIRAYGESKGRRILVGSWGLPDWRNEKAEYPWPLPKLDFVTISPTSKEIRQGEADRKEWEWKLVRIRKNYGDVPVLAVIDWGFQASEPLGVFSQELGKEKAIATLRSFDRFLSESGVLFAYPLHGGFMGFGGRTGAFGTSSTYDSVAPEFDTYATIRELALEKKGDKP